MLFRSRPKLFFGLSGAALMFLGFLVGVYALIERYVYDHGNRAFLYLVLLLVIAGLALFGFGFVGELVADVREQLRALEREVGRLRERGSNDR